MENKEKFINCDCPEPGLLLGEYDCIEIELIYEHVKSDFEGYYQWLKNLLE